MFATLEQFYNSTEWRQLRKKIINDRVNPKDGILYDELTGDIIVNDSEAVAHHKTELTLANVNDFSVSLNPANIIIVSQNTHNEIHARFGYSNRKKVFYVYGAPCSGKTTYVNNIKGNSDIVVDMDNIWECITGIRYEKPNALKTNAFMIRDLLLDMVKTRAGKWQRAFIIDGGAVYTERTRKIALYGAEPIFIDTNKGECLKRLATDKKRTTAQKELWTQYIERWFNDYTEG